jgi:Fe-S-cluster containining protein
MSRGFDFDHYAAKIQQMVIDNLKGAKSAADISRVMRLVTELAEKELRENISSEEKAHIACQAGCHTCCVVNVSVLFPEAVAIAEYLKKHFMRDDFEKLAVRINALYSSIRWLDDEERIFLRRSCAFLDDAGCCSIYLVRPLMCRSITSTDPERCKEAIGLQALGEAKPILMNLFQKALMEATFNGVAQGLEGLVMDSRGMRLTESVKLLMDKPGSVEDYLSGEPIRAG